MCDGKSNTSDSARIWASYSLARVPRQSLISLLGVVEFVRVRLQAECAVFTKSLYKNSLKGFVHFLLCYIMALRKILRVGNPLLRQESQRVPTNEISSKEIKKLVKDMFETMEAASGLGLAAPQIGVLKQIVIVGFNKSKRYPEIQEVMPRQILINPKIEVLSQEVVGSWEGCLSVPGMRGYVERPREIKLSWYDENSDSHQEQIEGFPAIVYQHECDHLHGILYIDRLKDSKLFGFCEELEQVVGQK